MPITYFLRILSKNGFYRDCDEVKYLHKTVDMLCLDVLSDTTCVIERRMEHKNIEDPFGKRGLLMNHELYQVLSFTIFIINFLDSVCNSVSMLQYILDTSVYPREPEPLKELRHAMKDHPM